MIYVRAGLFDEGKNDYQYLLPLLDRLLGALAAELFPGDHDVASSVGIDAPRGTEGGRAEKIAAAIHDRWEECTLYPGSRDRGLDARRSRGLPGWRDP